MMKDRGSIHDKLFMALWSYSDDKNTVFSGFKQICIYENSVNFFRSS